MMSLKLIIVGDLSEDLLNPNHHNLRNILLISSLQNTISEPIRLRALLDQVILSDEFLYLDAYTLSIPDTITN